MRKPKVCQPYHHITILRQLLIFPGHIFIIAERYIFQIPGISSRNMVGPRLNQTEKTKLQPALFQYIIGR